MKQLLFLLVFLPQLLFGQTDLTPNGWVNDYASILNQDEIQKLNSKISSFEKQTDIEISIAVVSNLNGKDVETFANELFKHWGVGKKDRNNGLLVVIAPNERKWRIEIGYGLEPYLSDGQSYDMGVSNFKPNFKAKQYFKGIDGFLTTLISHLGTSTWEDRMAYTEKLKVERDENISSFLSGLGYVILSLIALVVSIFAFKRFREKRERELKLKKQKLKLVERYKTKVNTVNESLKRYNFLPMEYSLDNEKLLMESKSESELMLKSDIIESSFYEKDQLISTAASLNQSLSLVTNIHDKITKFEKKFNLPITELPTNIFTLNQGDVANSKLGDVKEMKGRIKLINDQSSRLTDRYKTLSEFNDIISLGMLNILDYDNKLLSLKHDKRFKDVPYGLDDINTYYEKVKSSYDQFNNHEKTFDNLSQLKSLLKSSHNSENEFENYVNSVDDKNRNHAKIVDKVNNSSTEIKNQHEKLKGYLNNSDVSSSTKSLINSFIVTLLAYQVTSDLMESFNGLNGLIDKTNELIKKSKYEIESEESIRRRRREDEERKRREKKRKEEQEEEDRRRRDSYFSSSSWSSSSSSSSSSDSSWGGFGGGDSGGGGSSGDW
jgi:uncharacterized membrane protein YgcG